MISRVELHPGDNRESLRRLIDSGVRVHSVVTDPPYGLVSIEKRFGNVDAKPARAEKNDGSFARLSGGYVFAFSGSRTGHWQACAMELAGFIMHPMHGWVFGSGFPKAHAADKAIDRMLGVEGGFIPTGNAVKRMIPGADQHATGSREKNNGREYQPGAYVPGSPEAAEWEGWAYGTQAQKPALEPIYLGQKPFDCKTGAANLLKHGVGAVNIDGCRVPSEGGVHRTGEDSQGRRYAEAGSTNFAALPGPRGGDPAGRHPANLILDGSPDVVAMFPDSKSGAMKAGTVRAAQDGPGSVYYGTYGGNATSQEITASSGSAARFFHQFAPDADPLFYHAKAGKLDRAGSKHPTVKPIALMQYLIRHITPPGGTVLDPFAGSGTTAEAARHEGFDCILMEAEPEYLDFLRQRFALPTVSVMTTDKVELEGIFG